MKRRTAVLSYTVLKIVTALGDLGFETIETPPYRGLSDNAEASHADMQLLTLPDGALCMIRGNEPFNSSIAEKYPGREIILTKSAIEEFKYPECAALNAAVIGNTVIANEKTLDINAAERIRALGCKVLPVRQGYSKCSVCVVSDNAIITSDVGIARAAEAGGIDVLVISQGNIRLCREYDGFIGGASVLIDDRTVAFTGNIDTHPDADKIRAFCRNHGVHVLNLTDDPLFDIGGIVLL